MKDDNFSPEMMVPGFYMLCPKPKGQPIREGLTRCECPSCGRDCVVDENHAKGQAWKGLKVRCLHCLDPHRTPTPDNPPKR